MSAQMGEGPSSEVVLIIIFLIFAFFKILFFV